MMRRPTIYTLLGPHAAIRWDNGDRINELRTLNALSHFADCYYNGVLYVPGSEMAGAPGEIRPPEPGRYDLVYVRSNPGVFNAYEGPKMYLGLPFEAECFHGADAVATTTEYWRTLMRTYPRDIPDHLGFENYYNPETFIRPRAMVNLEQTIDTRFHMGCRDHTLTDAFRIRFGWGFTIAYMGRLHDNSLPYDLMDAGPRLKARYPDLNIVMAGPSKVDFKGRGVSYAGRIPYAQMPYAISACDLMVYDHDGTGEWLGAGKVLDALACDVPILCRRHEARVEQLGEDYPLYFTNQAELIDRVSAYRDSAEVRAHCHAVMAQRRARFQPEAVARRIQPQLQEVFGWR